MLKNFFLLAFICALVSCSKDSVQPNSNELVSADKVTDSSDYVDLPLEVRDIIANGVEGHMGCEISDNKSSKNGGSLGSYAYPLTSEMSSIFLLNSSLPCQPNIPYFIYNFLHKPGFIKNAAGYSATFYLVVNPNFSSNVKVLDVDWGLNGQNDPVPVKSFTVNNLQIGQSNSVSCEVFATDNKSTVYSQEMTFDFEVLLEIGTGAVVQYGSGYSYACTNTGLSPIIAP